MISRKANTGHPPFQLGLYVDYGLSCHPNSIADPKNIKSYILLYFFQNGN